MTTATARGVDSFSIQDAPMSRQESARSKDSFLNPTGPSPNVPAPEMGKWAELGLFVFFMLNRAVHPVIIDESKTRDPAVDDERKIRYSSLSTIIVMNVIILVVMQLYTLWDGGMEQWKSTWTNRRALEVFAAIGIVLAIGDWLEMLSMGGLSGSVYQILLQSKFIVTALIMMYLKGTRQTRLQWILLFSLMGTMSLYMSFNGGKGSAAAALPIFGMVMTVLKVIVSCLGGVMSDKYMKDLKDIPIHVQLVQMGVPRTLFTLLCSFTETGTWEEGLLHHWDWVTVGVLISFVIKSVISLYLLALLDALLKNIGEALAILFIYGYEIGPQILCLVTPGSEYCLEQAPFDVPRFIAVTTVVMIVVSYLETKALIEKAKMYDASLKAEKSKTTAVMGA